VLRGSRAPSFYNRSVEVTPGNVAPRILSRPEHIISRKNIDPEALKVLYRLKNHGFLAYLVGGGVRDLLLGRRPKDFDVSTSAHPQQVRKLFRNSFIVGRRFRLVHVRFGRKVVEVATFRRASEPEAGDTLIRRDNTFGTPEEDAFRRDFTVNALFYDIANFSVIDWVAGLGDLEARVIRTIGDPGVRFREDPVRMLRAIALAARLDFNVDPDTAEAIRFLRGEIVRSSFARILEEFYKILRQGQSRRTFDLLPEAHRAIDGGGRTLFDSLDRLDGYRNAGPADPDTLTNSLLAGSVLVPLEVPLKRVAAPNPSWRRRGGEAAPAEDLATEIAALGGEEDAEPEAPSPPPEIVLPFARRDLERLRLMILAQRRLREAESPSARQALAAKAYFDEALRWLEIHGGPDGPDLAARWRRVGRKADSSTSGKPPRAAAEGEKKATPRKRRRRRRRRPGTSAA
jgi:poly(A) polymerase